MLFKKLMLIGNETKRKNFYRRLYALLISSIFSRILYFISSFAIFKGIFIDLDQNISIKEIENESFMYLIWQLMHRISNYMTNIFILIANI